MTEQTVTTPNTDIARSTPDWFANSVIYQIWLRSFTPEGTLAAATQRLADIAQLGATVVYLCPVMLSDDDANRAFWSVRQRASFNCNARNPYRAKDYNLIDPEYGDESDLCRFVATAHRYGLRVFMDMVFLHCGPTCTLLEQPNFIQRNEDGTPKVTTWNFPLLNFESKELRQYLINNMTHWVRDCDVDGFRCDVSGNVPQDFWEEARDELEKHRKDIVMVAESDYEPREQVKAFDISYTFKWYDTIKKVMTEGKPASLLYERWEYFQDYYPKGSRFLRYCDNHDLHRASVVFGEQGYKAVATMQFFIDGIPMIYNGQEIGDATPQDLFSHWPIRWEAANLPIQKETRKWHCQLIKARKSNPVFSHGKTQWLKHDQPDNIVAFTRTHENQTALCIINLTNRPIDVVIDLPNLNDKNNWQSLLGQEQAPILNKQQAQISLGNFASSIGMLH